MKIPFFGDPKYQAPQVAAVPEGQSQKQNQIYVNEQGRCFRIDVFDHGVQGTLENALGTLEMAKDLIKHQMALWHAKEARRSAILVPKANGHG